MVAACALLQMKRLIKIACMSLFKFLQKHDEAVIKIVVFGAADDKVVKAFWKQWSPKCRCVGDGPTAMFGFTTTLNLAKLLFLVAGTLACELGLATLRS